MLLIFLHPVVSINFLIKQKLDILPILDKFSKAIGPDLLNPRPLKEAASILKYPLCRLFNLSLTLSAFTS
jgi:hypothetical protein